MKIRNFALGTALIAVLCCCGGTALAATPAPSAPADELASARQAVQTIYLALSQGDPRPLADALDLEAMLNRLAADAPARPNSVWMSAALARLEDRRQEVAVGLGGPALQANPRVLNATVRPDGTFAVTVRLYPNQSEPLWQRVILAKQLSIWRVRDVETLDFCVDSSVITVTELFNPQAEPLPSGVRGTALLVPALISIVVLAAGIWLGLFLRRRLSRPDGGGAGAVLLWASPAAGLLAALVIFGVALAGHYSRRGVIEALGRRSESLLLAHQNQLDKALSLWSGNRTAQIRRAMRDKGYLEALAATDSPPPVAMRLLATNEFQQGLWAEAARDYGRFSDAVGGDSYVLCLAARCAAKARDIRAASDYLAAASKAGAPDPYIRILRARTNALLRRPVETIAECRELMTLQGGSMQPRGLYAMIQQYDDFDPVRNSAEFKAFLEELSGAAALQK